MAEFDVAIVGGGPAGSTVACRLALSGHRVCLLQRAPQTESSRARWETLSPGALGLMRLHHRDVWPRIAILLIPCRAVLQWTRSDEHLERRDVLHGALVDRRLLDSVLLTSAIAAGANSRAINSNPAPPYFAGNSGYWLLPSGQSGTPEIRSRFLVDATGRSSTLNGTRSTLGPRTVALTAHVAGTQVDRRSTCLEALSDGWLWAGRGDDADAAVTLFISPQTVRHWPRGEHSIRFLQMLRGTSLVAPESTPRIVSNLMARDATIVERTPLTDDGLIRAGDAALALDPLSGQGFQHALVSAAQVATVLHTMLSRKESSALAREFYRARHAEAAQEHVSACRMFYQRQDRFNGEFWHERRGEKSLPLLPQTPLAPLDAWEHERLILSHEVRWKEVPVIAGEFVGSERALCHPSLTRPIAYLEGQIALDMLSDLSGEITPRVLLQRWADRAGLRREAGLRTLQFLMRHGILLPAAARSCCQSPIGLPPLIHQRGHRSQLLDNGANHAHLMRIAGLRNWLMVR